MVEDAAGATFLGRSPPVSPPVPAFRTGAAVARPLLQAPCNVRLDGALRRSLSDARVPSLSSVGCRPPFAMVEDAAGATFLFAAARGNLPEILAVKMAAPVWWNRARRRQQR